MLKSPFGIFLAAAGVVLAVSPDARKAARKLAVKGTGWFLDARDQVVGKVSEFPENIPSIYNENRNANRGTLESGQPHIDR